MDLNSTRKVVRTLLEGTKEKESKTAKDLEKELNIKSIWDNGGLTADRYTVVLNSLYNDMLYKDMYDSLALDGDPGSPDGFSQFTGAREGKHLGKQIEFTDLPENVQNHVAERLKVEPEDMEHPEMDSMETPEEMPTPEPEHMAPEGEEHEEKE